MKRRRVDGGLSATVALIGMLNESYPAVFDALWRYLDPEEVRHLAKESEGRIAIVVVLPELIERTVRAEEQIDANVFADAWKVNLLYPPLPLAEGGSHSRH